jgi:hypothetical protein
MREPLLLVVEICNVVDDLELDVGHVGLLLIQLFEEEKDLVVLVLDLELDGVWDDEVDVEEADDVVLEAAVVVPCGEGVCVLLDVVLGNVYQVDHLGELEIVDAVLDLVLVELDDEGEKLVGVLGGVVSLGREGAGHVLVVCWWFVGGL